MSSGKTHSVVSLSASIVTGSAVLFVTKSYEYAVISFSGFMFQILSSPDRDVNGGSVSEWHLRKINPFISLWWRLLWNPYSIAMKHRGKSHALHGTVARMLYLLFPPFVLLIKDRSEVSTFKLLSLSIYSQLLAIPIILVVILLLDLFGIQGFSVFFISVLLGDILHLIFDKL